VSTAIRFDATGRMWGTVQSYWEANLALLSDAPELDLYDREWVIHTRSEERAPARSEPRPRSPAASSAMAA